MKALRLFFQREARDDIEWIVRFIAEDNPAAAERFRVAVNNLAKLLMQTPDIGSPRIFQSSRLQGLRVLRVKDFEKYLVFYRVNEDTLEVLRVIHGMLDYPEFFET